MKRFLIISACLLSAAVITACSTLTGGAIGGFAGSLWGDARTGAATIGAIDDMFGY